MMFTNIHTNGVITMNRENNYTALENYIYDELEKYDRVLDLEIIENKQPDGSITLSIYFEVEIGDVVGDAAIELFDFEGLSSDFCNQFFTGSIKCIVEDFYYSEKRIESDTFEDFSRNLSEILDWAICSIDDLIEGFGHMRPE